jgi:hypothetical protein
MNLRSAREIERESQLFTNIRGGAAEGNKSQLMFLLVSGNRDVYPHGLEILRKPNISDSYHCKSRVFQFVSDNLSDFLTQDVGNSFRATHKVQSAGAGGRRQEKLADCLLPLQSASYSSVAATFSTI